MIQDYNGNDVVLFTDKGEIFIANCVTVSNVTIIQNTTSYYRDIPVIFQKLINNVTIVLSGFMNRDTIIRQIGEVIER